MDSYYDNIIFDFGIFDPQPLAVPVQGSDNSGEILSVFVPGSFGYFKVISDAPNIFNDTEKEVITIQ